MLLYASILTGIFKKTLKFVNVKILIRTATLLKRYRLKFAVVKKYVYLLLSLLPVFAVAQNRPGVPTLTGKVVDGETKQPIHAATVVLLHKDSSVAAEVISRPDGSFTLRNVPSDPLTLEVSVVGYQPFTKTIPAGHRLASMPLSAGTIRMTPMAVQMATVAPGMGWPNGLVTTGFPVATEPCPKAKEDRKRTQASVVSAGRLMRRQESSIADFLRKILGCSGAG